MKGDAGRDVVAAGVGEAPAVEQELESLRGRVRELEEAVQAREEFIATLAHELRNPLSPLLLQAQMLLDQVKRTEGGLVPTAWLVPRLGTFLQRLHQFLEMLNRLLEASHLQTGRMALYPEEVDAVAVVRDVAASMERELAAGRMALEIGGAAHVTGWWDRIRLEQVVRNLLSWRSRWPGTRGHCS
jgi:signal transduction histidine kinase